MSGVGTPPYVPVNVNYQSTSNWVRPSITRQASLAETEQHSTEANHLLHQVTSINLAQSQYAGTTPTSFVPKYYADLEPRDRPITIPIPHINGSVLGKETLQRYMTELCKTVWSRAFHFYTTGDLDYQHVKAYSSEQILQNLVRLSQVHNLTQLHFEIINQHLRTKLLEYMQLKYPITMNHGINRNLNNTVREVDRTHDINSEYLNSFGISFRFRQSGQYNDLIMRVMNQVMAKIDKKIGGKSVFEKFQNKMENLFESVKDLSWINERSVSQPDHLDATYSPEKARQQKRKGLERMISSDELDLKKELHRINQSQKDKYARKVQQYTQYAVGRKIPDNVKVFSEKEIQSQNIVIDNPQILRVLTKWCEQLEKKFVLPNFFQTYVDYLRVDKGDVSVLLTNFMKQTLDQLISEQSSRIAKEMKELKRNNSYMQSKLLQREKSAGAYSEYSAVEQSSAHYSIGMVNNLHAYLIIYLNRLIHGLLSVSKRFSKTLESNKVELGGNFNLITFQVMDLLRGKCSSGEKQVICLYNQIMKLAASGSIELIRVVNRLKKGTNDILINIRYRQVLCEVQLAVTSRQSKFIQFSNSFNHYLYELKRAMFGPLTQLSSIWQSLDARFQLYKTMKGPTEPQPEKDECAHNEYRAYILPFICTQCNVHYFHNNFIKPHIQCKKCQQWICARCQISKDDCKSQLMESFRFEEIESNAYRVTDDRNIPEFGICLMIERKDVIWEPFRYIEDRGIGSVLGIKNKKPYLICRFDHDNQKFRREYIIFGLGQFGKRHIKIDDDMVREYATAEKMKLVYRKSKLQICLNEGKFTNDQLSKICELGTYQQKYNIRQVELVDNCLEKISVISNQFKQIDTLQASKNKLHDFEGLQKLRNLSRLSLNGNRIGTFPKEICALTGLTFLSLCDNKLTSLPQSISNLTQLRTLRLSGNKFKDFPPECFPLVLLNQVDLRNNYITTVPAGVEAWSELTRLQLQNNYISSLHQGVSTLSKLSVINLNHNQIQVFPVELTFITGLTRCLLRTNKIRTITDDINKIEGLVELDVANNELTAFPDIIDLPRLHTLNISKNRLKTFPFLGNCCRGLRFLYLAYNQLRQCESLQNLTSLIELHLQGNRLQSMPPSLNRLYKLESLHLQQNKLTQLKNLHMERLKVFHCQQNKLTQCSGLNMRSLEELTLQNNALKIFMGNQLPDLRRINLAQNQLQSLQMMPYHKLQILNASYNQLKEVPLISRRSGLRNLSLQANAIKHIPDYLTQCTSLKVLNLTGNYIDYIPQSLAGLINLEPGQLSIRRNPLKLVSCMNFLKRMASKQSLEELNKFREEPEQNLERSSQSLEYSVPDILQDIKHPLRHVISLPPEEFKP